MVANLSISSNVMPLYIPSQAGDLFALFYPSATGSHKKVVIHIPAFAEEMNKSRRMVALQARMFSDQGYGVLILDLLGTGDSSGDFSDATWLIWQQNIQTAMDWLLQQGIESISLWGLRIGALLAMDFIAKTRTNVDKLICWQPVTNGEMFVMQFLRLRVAAAVMDRNAPQEKTSDLKQQLVEGKAIEVAGYLLNPELVKPLLALKASALDLSSVKTIRLFEMVASEDKGVSSVNVNFIEELIRKGQDAIAKAIVGTPFWSTQEIAEVPQLLTKTLASLS
ncbi:MAG: hydrolase 2, exosortase A system-associated [Methylococcaceae bacterium]|nr:hydrolase 2, exosortase A system-associated [Methylococcaceae bacterium]